MNCNLCEWETGHTTDGLCDTCYRIVFIEQG